METSETINQNRTNINKWFSSRFLNERKLLLYKNFTQGTHVNVDFSKIKNCKYKEVDELLIIALIPLNDTFIGMTGNMEILQAPLSIIK